MPFPTPPHFATHIGVRVVDDFDLDLISHDPKTCTIQASVRVLSSHLEWVDPLIVDAAFAMSRDYTAAIATDKE